MRRIGPCLLLALASCAAAVRAQSADVRCVLVAIQGDVRIATPGSSLFGRGRTNVVLTSGTRVRTGQDGMAMMRIGLQSIHRLGPNSEAQVQAPSRAGGIRQFLQRGLHYFFDRDGTVEINTSTASGISLGTEFVVQIHQEGAMEIVELTLTDGAAELRNKLGQLRLGAGEQGRSEPGRAPFRTSLIEATNVVQWFLYYPAVLDPTDLNLSAADLLESIGRYRVGDLAGAFQAWPPNRTAGSDEERAFRSALLLAVGDIVAAERELATSSRADDTFAFKALRRVIAAVTGSSNSIAPPLETASGLLAESYWLQSQRQIRQALVVARQATDRSPNFAFGWARVAELEFSEGDITAALMANKRARTLAPRHAQAVALEGFIFAARNQPRRARDTFSLAIALDARLGNAWLGRGLSHFRLGELAAGLSDLKAAAALEPNRALLRASLAKAWQENSQFGRARHELDLAARLDPADPTPSLYSALINYDQNRLNAAIGDLEIALKQNDNRAVFRSQLRLDEDRAVRGTGLARLYERAGLSDLSVREAARAVASDYGNYSAHLFLAESFDALRDPTRFNLRYETAWFNELLLADLLAPVGAGTFSPNISQQEYTRLFTREGLSLATVSDYRSDRQFRQLVTQSGFFGGTAWSLDLDYQHNEGVRPNNMLNRLEWYSHLKQQITAQDTALLLTKFQDFDSGDNFQYLDPVNASRSFRYQEDQKPIIVGGWRHEWSPGMQTLLLAGRLINDQRFTAGSSGGNEVVREPNGVPVFAGPVGRADVRLRGELETYTAELSQIAQMDTHTLVFGGRYQTGEFETEDRFERLSGGLQENYTTTLARDRAFAEDLRRWSVYAYETWSPVKSLQLTAGLAYNDVQYPANFRRVPLSSGQSTDRHWLPKAAVIWTPRPPVTVRGMYAKSVGGVSLEESYRLEPVQLGGFSQSFRTIIPESLAGSISAPMFDVGGVALDLKLPARIYLGFRGDFLQSSVDETAGIFVFPNGSVGDVGTTASTLERLRFREQLVSVTLDKLLGDQWTAGASYRFQRTRLTDAFPELAGISVAANDPLSLASRKQTADLHTIELRLVWNHSSGWFARANAQWLLQDYTLPSGRIASVGSETHCEVNAQLGWRFPKRRGEVSGGILNLIGNDYRLSPLSSLPEFPRERVLFARLKLYF